VSKLLISEYFGKIVMGGWDCLHYFKGTCVSCRPG